MVKKNMSFLKILTYLCFRINCPLFIVSNSWLQMQQFLKSLDFNPTGIALRKAKIVYNFGLSECNKVNWKRLISAVPLN